MGDNFEPRRPDWRLIVTDKATKARSTIGPAWRNEGGFISIQLGPCVRIDSNDTDRFYLSLVPMEES